MYLARLAAAGVAELDFVDVCYNGEITGVHVWSISWTVFAHEDHCQFRRKSTDNFVFSVGDPPLPFDLTCFGNVRFCTSHVILQFI